MEYVPLLATTQPGGSMLSFNAIVWIVIGSCILGLIYAFINYLGVKKINLNDRTQG
jgi:amino acid transporter